jgi:hypothetical protein
MLPAGRCIAVQADAEGWCGAIARRTRAGIEQVADEPGFPAFARAVFHSPEEAVRGEVAIEAAAHFGGIAAETGQEIEVFLQLGVGSAERANSRTLSKCSWFSMINTWWSPFRVGLPRRKPCAVQADVCAKISAEPLSGLRCELLVDPHLDGLARRLIETSSDRQSRNQPLHVFKPSGTYQDLTRTRTRHVRVRPKIDLPARGLVWFSVVRRRDARAPTAYRS